MKVFISADIEGISGVVSKAHTTSEGYDYQRARMLMTQEVNAAILGALDAGAEEILVGGTDFVGIIAQDPRRPERVGNVVAAISQVSSQAAIQHHDAIPMQPFQLCTRGTQHP